MPKVKIKISLSFIAYVIFLVLFGKGLFLLTYLLVLFIHEYSHAVVAAKLGYKLNNITLAPFGICLNIDNSNISRVDSVKIAFAGPCVNFLLAILCMSVWWAMPQMYIFTKDFFEANIVTGVFNLLPCFPLDGGRIAKECFFPQNSKGVFAIFNLAFSILFVVLFLYFHFNLSLLMVAVFLFLSIFTFSKSPKYDYLLYADKDITAVTKTKSYIVPSNLPLFKLLPHIEPNTFAIFYVVEQNKIIGTIYENQLKNLLQKESVTTFLKSVVLKNHSWQKF